MLSLLDGEVQASMIGEGITAADENILLDASGLTLHDMTGASIVTPTFGVGWLHDTLSGSEDFTAWTMGSTASVTGNTQTAPTGEGSTADTLNFPANGDDVSMLAIASPTLANGQTAMLMVWLKAAAAGTIHIEGRAGAGGTVIGTADVDVLTSWRRYSVLLTNSTGAACRVQAIIKRNTAGQLSSLYAWGAQCSYDVAIETPYYFFNSGGDKKWGVAMRSPLFISYETTGSILIGNDWITLPTGSYGVVIGRQAGDGASGEHLVALGYRAAQGNTGFPVYAIGYQAGLNNTYNKVLLIGEGSTATANQQIVFGSGTLEFTDLFGGGGVSQDSPTAFRLNATGGMGTNIAGGALNLAGGMGTGTGAGGSVVLQTAPVGSTGTAQNALVDRLTVASGGGIVINESGVDADVRIEGDTDANLLFVDASTDRVGIGTAAPGAKLHVAGNVGIGGSADNVALYVGGSISSANNAFGLYMGGLTLTPAASNYGIFQYVGGGTVATGASTAVGAAMALYCEAITKSGTGTIGGTYSIYAPKSSSGVANYGAYIEGDTGIGTYPVAGQTLTVPGYTFLGNLRINGADASNSIYNVNAALAITTNGGDLSLGQASTQQLIVKPSGFVGIGTTTPDTKLQVVGDAKFGEDTTNYLGLGSDGTLTLYGTAKYERHVQLPAKADGTVGNQPTSIDFFTAGGLQYPTTGAKYAFAQWEIPDDWDGTDVVFEVDWFPDSAAISGTDAVRWTVEYRSIAEGETIDNGTAVTVDNGAGGDTTDYARYVTKHSRFTLAFNNANQPLTKQDHVFFKISRDTGVANDFGGSVTVTAYEIIYQSNGFPSSN